MAVRADGAAAPGPIARFDVTVLEVARAKEATALGALSLRLYIAALLAAALILVALAYGRLVGNVLNQVLSLPSAILRVTDLLPISQAVAVLAAEATPAILAHSNARPATGPEPARHSALRHHQTPRDILLDGVRASNLRHSRRCSPCGWCSRYRRQT